MKIFYIYQLCSFGGVERVLLNRSKAFIQNGIDIHISVGYLYDLGALKSFQNYISENSLSAHISASLLSDKSFANLDEYDFIFNIDTPHAFEFTRYAKNVYLECHTPYMESRQYLKEIPPNILGVIVPSLSFKKLLLREFEALPEIYVLPNPVAQEFFNIKTSESVFYQGRPIAYLARLDNLKNYTEALDIFQEFKDDNQIIYSIIGTGFDDDLFLKTLHNKQIMGKSFWRPKLDFDAVPSFIGMIREHRGVFLSPSTGESFGLSAAEFMSAGVPVLLSDINAHQDLVDYDQRFLYPLGDIHEASEKLRKILDDWDSTSNLVKKYAHKFQGEEFTKSWQSFIGEQKNLIEPSKDLEKNEERRALILDKKIEAAKKIAHTQMSTILDKDRVIAQKDLSIHELQRELVQIKGELHNVTTSKFWLVLRTINRIRIFLFPFGSAREDQAKRILSWAMGILNRIYHKMPLSVQRKTAPYVRSIFSAFAGQKKIGMPGDISWEEFQDRVLSHRDGYKGVFIQKPVIDWGVPLYQRPQHIASALGKLGYLVIYQTDNFTYDNVDGFRNIGNNVWLTNSEKVDTIEETVHSVYSTAYGAGQNVLKEFYKPDSWMNKRNIFVYEYIDHIDPKITADDHAVKTLKKLKDFVFKGASDVIVVSAKQLGEEAIRAVGKDKVLSIPNGVDVEHYRNINHQSIQLSANYLDFRKKYTKIVGYFGALAPWLWYGEINKLAQMRTDLGFVFIGPDYVYGSTQLPKLKNILWLGPIDYSVLPAYARPFDICFIPFEPGEIAATTSPLKLFEYFALEKPVVTTSFMKECVAFDEVFHGNTAETLSHAIDRAFLVKDDSTYKAKLAQLADQNSWLERAKKLKLVFNQLK